MALPEGSNKVQYTVSTPTTDFDFPYKYWDATDFVVTSTDLSTGNDTTLDYNAGEYTVNATNGDTSLGATIVTVEEFSDNRITIERVIPVESESDFVRGDGLPPDALNSEFDKAAAQRQQLDDQVARQLSHPASDPDGLTYEAPTAEDRANKVTGWDADGNVTAVSLAESGTVGVDTDAGLEINSNIISAKINTAVMEFDSGDINVKDSGISTAKIADLAVTTAKIEDEAVTLGKMAPMNTSKVLGNMSGGSSIPSEIAVIDDDTLGTATDTNIATAESIKAYVDSIDSNDFRQFYYGDTTPVFSGTAPTAYTDLDLSSITGAGRFMVTIAFDGGFDGFVSTRKNGDSRRTYDTGSEGAGISGGSTATTSRIYASMVTDENGIIEWLASVASSMTVYLMTYQKLV